MPKRKREGQDESTPRETETHPHPRRRSTTSKRPAGVTEKIHHGKTGLHRALKLAKGFERQKLGRRCRDAVRDKSDAQLARLDAEVQALKTVDLNAAAETHLFKALLKEKAIRTSPLLPGFVSAERKLARDTPTANVTARLYNSNAVKEALAEVMPLIRFSLGLGRGVTPATEGRKSRKKVDLDRNKPIGLEELDGTVRRGAGEDTGGSDSDSGEDADSLMRDAFASAGDAGERFAGLDSLVGSESDDDSAIDLEIPLEKGRNRVGASNHTIDLSISPSPSPSQSQSQSPSPPPPRRAKRSTTKPELQASAMFIPSLTMGGYWSGSDGGSEPEQNLEETAPPRKNRRGQRERRMIWEKKFGNNANHLQNGAHSSQQSQGKGGRDQGWDLKRGAQMESEAPRKNGYQPRWAQRRDTRTREKTGSLATGGNMTEIAPRPAKAGTSSAKVNGTKALHPSWEAAKKAKEQRKAGSFVGKKVVFD